jgi:hypothetical protein
MDCQGMTTEQKAWIDNATYFQLLERWRMAPIGDPMFLGDTGQYYSDTMKAKRAAVGQAEHVAASKAIG